MDSMNPPTRHLSVAWVAMLLLAVAAGAQAADPAPPAATRASPAAEVPVEQLQQLDEITVRGKHLAVAIEDAENEYFALYNKVNKDFDFQITCGQRSIRPGSMITTRVCVPEFYLSYGDVGAPAFNPGTCYGYDTGYNVGGYTGYSSGPCNTGGYEPPPRELVLMARSKEWYDHMMQVTRSDARLSRMAGHLDDLHNEMTLLQNRYVKVRRDSRPVKSNLGPRVL